MTIDELEIKLSDEIFDNQDVNKVELLLEAINDWPDPINSLDDYLEKLELELGCSNITYKVVDKISSKLNLATQAWKAESYSVLMKLMQLCNYKSLNEIVSYLDNYKKN